MNHIEIIDTQLLNEVSMQAKQSPHLRMNNYFHQLFDEKRMLNTIEPGTVIPIHRHLDTSEEVIILRDEVE